MSLHIDRDGDSRTFKHPKKGVGRSDWVTPPEIIERARQALGGIELDPATCKEVNDRIVQANRIYTIEDDGLAQIWNARTVWLNPPYGWVTIDGKEHSSQAVWTRKGMHEWASGSVKEGMITLVSAGTSQAWFHPIWEQCLMCFPFKRIPFLHPVTYEPLKGNQYNNAIAYWGKDTKAFTREFKTYGYVVKRVRR